MYGKIFDTMYDGTLYGQWQAIVTLQQMLVLCTKDGVIDMTPQAIAARTSIPFEIIEKGLEILSQPDPYSRTPGEEGRRICLIDEHRPWGWYIVNHAKYQKMQNRADKQEADRVRVAAKRNNNKTKAVADSRKVSPPVADVAHATADVYATAKNNKGAGQAFALPLWIPDGAWKGFEETRNRLRKPMTARAKAMIVRELEKLKEQGHNPVAVLEQSERNGWQDVFPLKVKSADKPNGSAGPPQVGVCGHSLSSGSTMTSKGLVCTSCWNSR